MPFLPSVPLDSGSIFGSVSAAEAPLPDVPQDRNVANIVESCLITIFACTWVSIHPNVPSRHENRMTIAFRRGKLMVLALLAPEVILLWAIRQRIVAHQMHKGMSIVLEAVSTTTYCP